MVAQDNKKIGKLLKITEENVKRVERINPNELAQSIMIAQLNEILAELKKLNKKVIK